MPSKNRIVLSIKICGLLWLAALTAGAGSPGAAPADALAVEEVAPGVFVHTGLYEETDGVNQGDIANCGFIVGTQAVAVIDSGGSPAVGERLREAIRLHTDRPVRYVINTHMHPDHLFGDAAFLADGPVFLAHRNLEAALTARADHYGRSFAEATGTTVRVVAPTQIVADRMEIDLGGRVLELVAHPPAHTDNDLTVFDRQTATLWTGDLVFMERAPAIDGSVLGWLEVLRALTAVPAVRAVPGHGPAAAPWPQAASDLQGYLGRLVAGIREIQKAGGTIQQAIDRVAPEERPKWRLFDDYHPRNVTAAFAELEWAEPE